MFRDVKCLFESSTGYFRLFPKDCPKGMTQMFLIILQTFPNQHFFPLMVIPHFTTNT